MKIVAYAYMSGHIGFGGSLASGALPIASGEKEEVEAVVSGLARHSRTGDDLFVPGIPEAANPSEALDALLEFEQRVAKALSRPALQKN